MRIYERFRTHSAVNSARLRKSCPFLVSLDLRFQDADSTRRTLCRRFFIHRDDLTPSIMDWESFLQRWAIEVSVGFVGPSGKAGCHDCWCRGCLSKADFLVQEPCSAVYVIAPPPLDQVVPALSKQLICRVRFIWCDDTRQQRGSGRNAIRAFVEIDNNYSQPVEHRGVIKTRAFQMV